MCKCGNTVPLSLPVPAHVSRTGEFRWDIKDIDSCIAHIVRALNDAGVYTIASCCGHGKRPANIALVDGREIVIMPDHETARQADSFLNQLGFKGICE